MFRKVLISILLVFSFSYCVAKQLPELEDKAVKVKLEEIMKAHVTYKKLNPTLVKRALENFMEELDPNKTYLIEVDIHRWLEPSDELTAQVLRDYDNNQYTVFHEIYKTMLASIERRHLLEKQIDPAELPKHVNQEQFKDLKWAKDEKELLNRLIQIKGLQVETASKLADDVKEKSLQRIAKRQAKFEEELTNPDESYRKRYVIATVLKAFASSLDMHTSYFTPAEATQFMINVQQKLFGIGAQLRDDVNGFSVTKIIDGGPASTSELKIKDRIIAVDNEPVVGMDIEDAVDLIRGEEKTQVVLTVIREPTNDEQKLEQKLDIPIERGEVVLKETRYETAYEPFGDGAIAYLRLYSFYQDPENSSSALDLARELKKLKEEHNVKAVILDLRFNSGGLLSQAVAVTGLFITKGIVVSIKDEDGSVQHLRDLDGKTVWDGPLIVLVNRASASASEIVAQTLQDYGRALVVGDDHTFGKGSFQTFTLNTNKKGGVNPEGEYKVTRGRYYTVSGRSPQMIGVISDILIPGVLSETEIGEKYAKNPLETDNIPENFEDNLSDVPANQREKVASVYKFDLQKKVDLYSKYLEKLKTNSADRLKNNKNYQNFLKEIKKKVFEEEEIEEFGQNDLQKTEAENIAKDLVVLMMQNHSD